MRSQFVISASIALLATGVGARRMRIDAETRVEPETRRARYLFLDSIYVKYT